MNEIRDHNTESKVVKPIEGKLGPNKLYLKPLDF